MFYSKAGPVSPTVGEVKRGLLSLGNEIGGLFLAPLLVSCCGYCLSQFLEHVRECGTPDFLQGVADPYSGFVDLHDSTEVNRRSCYH